MLILPGCQALSGFRLAKLLNELQSLIPDIVSVDAYFIHFVDLNESLNEHEHKQLRALLNYGGEQVAQLSDGEKLIVIPRPGTISPWSSKATDILHNSGLQRINRVERGLAYLLQASSPTTLSETEQTKLHSLLHDRMTEIVISTEEQASVLFAATEPEPLKHIDIVQQGKAALEEANTSMGLALSDAEINYLYDAFQKMQRNPTDVELMMFAQANSEHCRHKIFNADFKLDGNKQDQSLFGMIRQTHESNPGNVLSAYHDNAAVMKGYAGKRFLINTETNEYHYQDESINILMKVETHNHPTAISPHPGAATGSGGEIRDEAATGRGAKPKAGLCGFSVSNLKIPGFDQAWEKDNGKPDRIVSALDIMLEGPIGAASYNNEFGRPALCGYFRSYEQQETDTIIRGYHKPIMLAGGYGMIRESHIDKHTIPADAKLIVLGGPAMLIGLGGGAASSMASGTSDASLDFASVQRDNAEMQRRCQEVVDRCWAMGDSNPILSIHDVGAGGLSNAMPELVSACERGANLEIRKIPNDEPGMSPMGIWCNESQERYVLAIDPNQLDQFERLCQRERAPFAVLGEATQEPQLRLNDSHFNNHAIDIPMSVLLGKMPTIQRDVNSVKTSPMPINTDNIFIDEALSRVLHCPTVASKQFLITIGDRSVSGLVVRDQMVGPWQVPVADCAVTSSSYYDYIGEAMAMGERTPIAVIDAPASGRMAIAEAILNICAARILKINDISFSANWMAACGEPGQDADLYATVSAVSQLCQALGIAIPVGKDSLSMNTVWLEQDITKQVTSPLSVTISAFARVADTRQSLTPQLVADNETVILFIDLAAGKARLGGSVLAQVFEQFGDETPDVDNVDLLLQFFNCIQLLNESDLILAYHDRSDGGLIVTLLEMAFAARCGLSISCDDHQPLEFLFNEELGAVIQIRQRDLKNVLDTFERAGFDQSAVQQVASIHDDAIVEIVNNNDVVYSAALNKLQQDWAATSFGMQSLRDNPECAKQEFALISDSSHRGLSLDVNFSLTELPAIHITQASKPKVAILREQGVNGQVEMAAAFDRAGFTCIDVHMQDLIAGNQTLDSFDGLVACGGFSYGDVLGAGGGWAKTILFTPKLTDMFSRFFTREDTFALGVCNGCQMMSQLRELIPGTNDWPDFVRNESEQFESRLVMVEVMPSSSILFKGMAGSRIPVVVAHGEGRVNSDSANHNSLRYIDSQGKPTETYPLNPNGSANGIAGLCSADGRVTIMMPHPERVFLSKQFSWLPREWKHEYSPWMQLFLNARRWLD